MYRLLLLVIALIVYGSLYPWHFAASDANPLVVMLHSPWPGDWGLLAGKDAMLNIAVYVPLGVCAFLAMGWRGALCAGLVLSLCMELLQVYVPGRTASIFDVVCNVAGAAAGTFVAWRFRGRWKALTGRRPRQLGAAFLLACWAGVHLYPFFPMLSWGRLRYEFLVLLHPCEAQYCCCTAGAGLAGVWSAAAEWFVAMFALQALAGRMRARWILAALCVRIALRPLVITRPLGPDEVLGAVLALVLWKALRERARLRVSLAMLAIVVLISELAPFRFSSTPAEFSWIPFQMAIETERQGMVLALLRKAFDYGGLVWLLYLAGASYARAGVAVAVFVGVLEGVQRYVPGRQPSITDPVLIVLIAMGLALTDLSGRTRVSGREDPIGSKGPRSER